MALTSHDSQRNPSGKSFTQVWGSVDVNHTKELTERAKTFEKFCALRTNLTQQNLWKFWLARACRSDKTIWEFWEWTLCNGKEGNGEKEKEKAKRRKAKTRIVFTFLRVLTLLFFQFGLLFAHPPPNNKGTVVFCCVLTVWGPDNWFFRFWATLLWAVEFALHSLLYRYWEYIDMRLWDWEFSPQSFRLCSHFVSLHCACTCLITVLIKVKFNLLSVSLSLSFRHQ